MKKWLILRDYWAVLLVRWEWTARANNDYYTYLIQDSGTLVLRQRVKDTFSLNILLPWQNFTFSKEENFPKKNEIANEGGNFFHQNINKEKLSCSKLLRRFWTSSSFEVFFLNSTQDLFFCTDKSLSFFFLSFFLGFDPIDSRNLVLFLCLWPAATGIFNEWGL